ncbi:protein phosphatase 2C domain-containing protein [Sorangium sp. So ce315]|uniref:PP2C family protein-serine/threonine phosphatase n=1 Tax=Sorangium sp. So ce315 TaxID=3133299 RepID=UPI003F5F0473
MMPPTESPLHLKIEFAQASDAGRDPNKQVNEDACGYAETQFGHLCVLCDGMGGHYGGSEASRTAIKTIFDVIEQTPATTDPRAALKAAIEEAARRVYQLGGPADNRARPGSTVVAMVLHDGGVDIAHVGDSRAYVIRSNQIYPLTRDHSMVQGMLDAGMITEAQAIGHPDANKITRALGMKPEVEVEVRPEPMELYPGDVLIQTSDGLTDLVLSGDILGCTRQALASGSVEHACRMLVQLANHRGGHDNITVQMARVIETGGRSLTIAHGPPGASGAGGDAPRPSRPQETVAMTRPERAASGEQGLAAAASAAAAAPSAAAAAAGAPAAAPSASPGAGGAAAPRPASNSNAPTVVPTGNTPAPQPVATSDAITVVPAGSDRRPAVAPQAASSTPQPCPATIDSAPAAPALRPTVTDDVPAKAPKVASGALQIHPTIDSEAVVVATLTDNLPPVAAQAAGPPQAAGGAPQLHATIDGAPAVHPTANDGVPAVSPTATDGAPVLSQTVPGGPPPAPHQHAPDAPAVLSPLPVSAPAASAPPPMAQGAAPHPGPFGAAPHPGAPTHPSPFGAPPPQGAPHGAPPPQGAPHGAPPPQGAPHGAPPPQGAPHGAPPPQGAPPQPHPFGAPPHPGAAAFGAPPPPGAPYGAPPHPGPYGAPPHPGTAAFGAPPHMIAAQDAPPVSVGFSGHHAQAPGGPPAAPPHHHLAPAPPSAHGYGAPAPSFSGPMSSSVVPSVPTTVRAQRGVTIAAIAALSAVIVVLLVILLWKLIAG